ncbi:hypothetical protein [Ferrimicrobium acidiphilum]|uniref:hypothetical protein n=1 Tax=Ferrimicrobium acidiphilum TaxID=121039 RepID=UPI0023EFE67E|nr:hypothetical protein [Ferrimicrobium acidiphilum]
MQSDRYFNRHINDFAEDFGGTVPMLPPQSPAPLSTEDTGLSHVTDTVPQTVPTVAKTSVRQPEGSNDSAPARTMEPHKSQVNAIPGTANGNLRVVTLSLPREAREVLDRATRETQLARGQVVMIAVREQYREILSQFAVPSVQDEDPFGPPRVIRRRKHLDEPRSVPLYLTDSEALGLSRLKDSVTLSMSGIVTEAILRHYGRAR